MSKEFSSIATFMDKEPCLTPVIPACPESFFSAGFDGAICKKDSRQAGMTTRGFINEMILLQINMQTIPRVLT
jgi:hypothetical protein